MFDDLKPILILLLRFLATYLGLILLYQFYLNLYSDAAADPLTKIIAEQSTFCMNKMGYNTQLIESTEKSGLYFYINNIWATTMIEGCNAVSIMILYLAFIFTFYKGLQTFWFAVLGLVFLYVVNVTRIALINIVYMELSPEHFKIAHDYAFPAIIYGGVVFLWIIWIKFFVLKK